MKEREKERESMNEREKERKKGRKRVRERKREKERKKESERGNIHLLRLGNFAPLDELHSQHPWTRAGPIDVRDVNAGVVGKICGRLFSMFGFLDEIQLFAQVSLNLFVHPFKISTLEQIWRDPQHQLMHKHIACKLAAELGKLHFNRHGTAVWCDGPMHLRQRGGGQGLRIERLIQHVGWRT